MIRYWHKLQNRERAALVIAAIVVSLLSFYIFLWEPISSERARLRQSVAAQQQLLGWMQAAVERVKSYRSLSSSASGDSKQSLLVRVEASAKEAGLSKNIRRIQPDSNNNVRVWIDAASFDEVVEWLVGLIKEGDVATRDLAVNKAAAAGTVNVRLLLQRTSS